MTIYIGADHRGFSLKEVLKEALKKDGYEVIDVGAAALDPVDDYPDFARAVAEKVAAAVAAQATLAGAPASATATATALAAEARGIVICGSGFGVDIVANKFKGVRSALAMSAEHIRVGRHDDDVNVLSIAANFIKPEDALAIARVFLATPFENNEDRYVRRLDKIRAIEAEA
jgi:ribose 5-phosphate isomerase B